LGRFRFVFYGQACGNWDDETDLKACYSWLKDFAEIPRQRFEPGLMELSSNDIFKRLVEPILGQESDEREPECYPDTFSRFHISHLGMSSFDQVTMVLIEDDKIQRCVWRSDTGALNDCRFESGLMQKVAKDFCNIFEIEAAQLGLAIK
jgi:hypothetical protein